MKKLLLAMLPLLVAVFSSCSYDDTDIWNKVNDLDGRVTNLEASLTAMNTSINDLSTIVNNLSKNLTVKSVALVDGVYQIVFSDGSTVNLTNGKDGADGATPFVGDNGNWWIGNTDTGVRAKGQNGNTPRIGDNGNWWIGSLDTGVRAAGVDGTNGQTPYIGANGDWWIGTNDTGVRAAAQDGTGGTAGQTPYIGENGNWWIGTTDTGVRAAALDGLSGTENVPIIGVAEENGIYYWTKTINGVKSWLTDANGNKFPVTQIQPVLRVNYEGYWQISYDNEVTFQYIYDEDGDRVKASGCDCTQFFKSVTYNNGVLILVLIDGTVVRIDTTCDCCGCGNECNATANPTIDASTTNIPNVNYAVSGTGKDAILELNMTGILIPGTTDSWLELVGNNVTGQNVWISIDDKPMCFTVSNIDNSTTIRPACDLIFTVDNSGTMYDEAEVLAADVKDWAEQLANDLNMRFGCVGFDGSINGAINLTDAESITNYLNRTSGLYRTRGFVGDDATNLQSKTNDYYTNYDECGVAAIMFANDNFTFREGANRIYVNFTDEPNQPNGKSQFSVDIFNDPTKWNTNQGTVHTIYSDTNTSYYTRTNYYEYPWLASDYTGGTKIFTDPSFRGVRLPDLPVTSALTHSYVISIANIADFLDGQDHQMKITVLSEDGVTKAERTFTIRLSSSN